MGTPTTDRRRFLTGSAIAAAGIVAAPSALAAGGSGDRGAWDRAMAAYRAADAAAKADDAVFARVCADWQATAPSDAMIDWENLPVYVPQRNHTARVACLTKMREDFLADEGRRWWGPPETKAKRLAAIDSIQRYRDAVTANDLRHGIDEAGERNDRLGEAFGAAEDALIKMPAPDMDALRWKLEFLFRPDNGGASPCWDADYLTQTMADIARLLGGEA